MMKRFKVTMILAALVLTFLFTPAYADAYNTAQAAAAAMVPAGYSLVEAERDDVNYEFTYRDAQGSSVEVKVNINSSEVVRVEEKSGWGGTEVAVTRQQAEQIALLLYADGLIYGTELEQDDGLYRYEVGLADGESWKKVYVDARSGEVVGTAVSYNATVAPMTLTAALQKAMQEGDVVDIELKYRKGQYCFDVDFVDGEGRVWADGTVERVETEKVLTLTPAPQSTAGSSGKSSGSSSGSSSGDIGSDRAGQIALDRAGGGKIKEIERDRENGRLVYEGEIVNGNWEYEFEIDAATGEIRKWESERDD